MMQQATPHDYIIATGRSDSLQDFVSAAFGGSGLDWRDYVKSDASLLRPADHRVARADASLAMEELGWTAQYDMPVVVDRMIKSIAVS